MDARRVWAKSPIGVKHFLDSKIKTPFKDRFYESEGEKIYCIKCKRHIKFEIVLSISNKCSVNDEKN